MPSTANPETLVLHETAHPDRPLVFTLDGDTFSIDITALFAPETPKPGAPPPDPIEQRMEAFALKMVQTFTAPAHVRDVLFVVHGDQVTLQMWKRSRGLRLTPATIGLSGIDNPAAAADFAAQLQARAASSASPARFPGLLDYWGSWVLMGAGVVTAAYSLYRLFVRGSRDR